MSEASAAAAARGPWMLQMGYWSDEMEADGIAPDVFFMSFDDPDDLSFLVEGMFEAWRDKYERLADVGMLDAQDLFWSCAPKSPLPGLQGQW